MRMVLPMNTNEWMVFLVVPLLHLLIQSVFLFLKEALLSFSRFFKGSTFFWVRALQTSVLTLNGIQPRDFLGANDLRKRGLLCLNCLHRVASSALTHWAISIPICEKTSPQPATYRLRSNALY